MFLAGVAHPVERHLAKVEVASSSLVTRSNFFFQLFRLERSDVTVRWTVTRDGSTERNLYFRISENANRIRPVSPYGPFV